MSASIPSTAAGEGRIESPYPHEWLFVHAERTPDASAIATPTTRLTYGVLADRVRALVGHLDARGVGRGDRVLIALPNTPATVVAGLAVNALGATAVELNRAWSADVLASIVATSNVRTAFIWGRDARTWGTAMLTASIDHLLVVHPAELPTGMRDALGDNVTLVLEDGEVDPAVGPAPSTPELPSLQPEHAALILYTSGTTGRPQGVIQTFRNIDANTRSIVEYLQLTADDRAMLVLPLFYCYGRSVLQTHLLAGGSVFLDTRFAFPRVVLEEMRSEGCTGFAGVPLTFEIIRRQVDVSSIPFDRLRYVTQAGGAMAADTIAWARTVFAPAKLFVMYGQTEATARLSYLPPGRGTDKAGSIGIPIPGVELRVVDEAGRELPRGEIGELVARGENVTPGYLDAPSETASILHDGWLWTGDLAVQDEDGFFYHRGRAKEILKIGGHRVSPVEIEQVIERHPGVAEAAVIGLPDDLSGEVPAAFVIPRTPQAPSSADLRRFCQERLPPYQVPVSFAFVDALPRSESGKLLRAELRRAGA